MVHALRLVNPIEEPDLNFRYASTIGFILNKNLFSLCLASKKDIESIFKNGSWSSTNWNLVILERGTRQEQP